MILGLQKEIKTGSEEIKFLKPAKLTFMVKKDNMVLTYEFEFDKFNVIHYQKPNYSDDKIITKTRAEYIFRADKGLIKKVKEK